MMETENNVLKLCGVIESAPVLDHEVFGEQFYRMELKVPRLSGTYDLLPVTVSERLMEGEVAPGMQIGISGQLRSYNKVIGGSGRLLLTAFAQQLETPDETQNPNTVQLVGAICKPPSFRTTPFGREIADLMLAVNRSFGKSDYIPCIAWGRTARYAATLQVGDKLRIQGRFQSREYQKQMPDGNVINRIAYEVSISRLSCLKEEMPLPDVMPDSEIRPLS
ncbi:MAG: single-stranded DNA-binding protein [Clostridia bacterium]|nr:single-stranded DNA-binding protein [Clostridia bacterium]MBR6810741.1 single-stranded DNA-binding protein [Clostridia bacterium]